MNANLAELYRGVLGFFAVQTLALLIITYVPDLSLWLVGLL